MSRQPPGEPTSGLPVHPQPRPRRAREWPLGLVLAGVAAGLAAIGLGALRPGTLVIAASLLAAAALRVVLPERTCGLLVVRSRLLDAAVLAVLGVGLTVLGVIVRNPGV